MKRRIIICLSILLALCLLGDVIAMLFLGRSISRLSAVAEFHRIQSMRTELVSSAVRVQSDLLAFRAGRSHDAGQRDDHLRRFKKSVHQCTTCHHPPSLFAQLSSLQQASDTYEREAEKLFAAATRRPDQERNVQSLVDHVVREATRMADLADRHLVVRSSDAAASVQQAWIVLSATMVAALIVGGFVAYDLKRRLTEPVEALLANIEAARRGDRTRRVSVHADEEFRTLGQAFDQAYAQLQNAQEGVFQAEKMAAVGKLAAGVAHEVGNPLASISSIAQLMRRKSRIEEDTKRLDLIMEQIARISRIVRNLLTFSRPTPDKQQTTVAIGTLLQRATSLLSYDRRAEQIKVSLDCDPDLRPVQGDADRLLLVFTNVIINAFDALSDREHGEPAELNITARQVADEIEIRFKDNGPGMNEAQIAEAFEPFFTTKAPGAGTGLGLWICYETVQKHSGSITIQSRIGQGTTVVVRLPSEHHTEQPRNAKTSAAPESSESRLSKHV